MFEGLVDIKKLKISKVQLEFEYNLRLSANVLIATVVKSPLLNHAMILTTIYESIVLVKL